MRRAMRGVGSACLCVAAIVVTLTAQNQPVFDRAAVERGRELFGAQCGFCHGANARGGAGGGSDLTRSALVQTDENGKQIGEFLRVGRPERGMPPSDLAEAQVSDLAAFLHSEIYLAANRRLYRILDVLTGDPTAGEAFFNGAGKCRTCHQPDGDLKGVGAKYDPPTLQGRMLLPRGRPPGSTSTPPEPAYKDRNAVKVSVTGASGESVTGALVRLTDFDVVLYDPASGRTRSWLRNDDVPKIVVTDPLQAHVDLLTEWSDADMHNVTAYLARLK